MWHRECVRATVWAWALLVAAAMGCRTSSDSGGEGTDAADEASSESGAPQAPWPSTPTDAGQFPLGDAGCTLFACSTTSDCRTGLCIFAGTTSAGASAYCYIATDRGGADCSIGARTGSVVVRGRVTTVCVPAGCPEPLDYRP
jgi:hypothetical protein